MVLTYLDITIAVRGLFKSKYFYITVTVGAPLKSRYTFQLLFGACDSMLLTHYSCCWGPLGKQSTYTLQFLLGALQ